MEQGTQKTFNHDKASASDKIRLIGELEHIRAHALRSATAVFKEDDDSEAVQYLIIAKRAQNIRREYMREHFPQLKEQDWCLCKAAATLRQILYEVNDGWPEELKEIEDLIDEIIGKSLGMDMSGCISCREDYQSDQAQSEEV